MQPQCAPLIISVTRKCASFVGTHDYQRIALPNSKLIEGFADGLSVGKMPQVAPNPM
jgi:hypothetical protein